MARKRKGGRSKHAALAYVLIAFVCSVLAVTLLGLLDGSAPAVVRVGAAATTLAGGLVALVGHYLGRKHDEDPKPRCPICKGEFPDDEVFKQHSCALAAVAPRKES